MLNILLKELRHHAPFTLAGTLVGVISLIVFRELPTQTAYQLFYTLHPVHVVFSAMATASMYSMYKCGCLNKRCNLGGLLVVGLLGSIGVATLSDCIIPYIGERLLGMPNGDLHIGIIEEPGLVLPMALLGITFAYFRPSTKFPHFGHVILSTLASSVHIILAGLNSLSVLLLIVTFFFLFFAVWLPCCLSDIIFPLLFVKPEQINEHNTCH